MNLNTRLQHLKPVRVVVSLVLLVATSLVFLDLGNTISSWISSVLVPFQLIPALTKSIVSVGFWTVGAVVVLLLTVAFGRVYCSTLCPLGTLQDVVIRLAERFRGKRRFRFKKPQFAVHYGVFAVTAGLFLGGSLFVLNLLEPFSSFGRLLQALVRPVVIGTNNAAAAFLGLFDVYTIYQVPFHEVLPGVTEAALAFLGVIVSLSWFHGRLFCNLLCPAGALLGLVSRVAMFRIVIDRSTCKECGLCEKVCKASCIDADRKHVEYSACVSCFNCLKACPTVGLKYAGLFSRAGAPEPVVNLARRRFVAGSAASLAVLLGPGGDTLAVAPPAGERQRYPVTPPGSGGLEHFTGRCTACHLCVSVCPTRVLTPAFLDYGLAGVLQPKMDYWTAYCNYDCKLCSEVCPSGAILPLSLEEKKLVQLGKAVFVKEDCIVITKKKDCGACSEHCPTKAVTMVPYEGALMLPELRNEICVGCGACEKTCPTKPRKAIYVESNVVHLAAKKPEIKKLEKPAETLQEFPF